MDEGLSGFRIKSGSRSNGGGGTGGGGTKCGRWNPTAEQVKVLTDLFTSGLRTPSTDQIQKISSQLSFYGKIESKNVFYWFQNHKARERQKRRRISVQDRSHHHQIEQEPKSFPAKRFAEMNQGQEPDQKVIETLQLFPLNSYEESEWGKQRVLFQNECKETTTTMFACAIGRDQIEHPPLDLRLSFL